MSSMLALVFNVDSGREPWLMFFPDTVVGLLEAIWHLKNIVEEAAGIWTSACESELRYMVPVKHNRYLCIQRIVISSSKPIREAYLHEAEVVISAAPENREFRIYLDTPDERSQRQCVDSGPATPSPAEKAELRRGSHSALSPAASLSARRSQKGWLDKGGPLRWTHVQFACANRWSRFSESARRLVGTALTG